MARRQACAPSEEEHSKVRRNYGKLLAANPFEKVNWATHIDKETGRPVETELGKKVRAGAHFHGRFLVTPRNLGSPTRSGSLSMKDDVK